MKATQKNIAILGPTKGWLHQIPQRLGNPLKEKAERAWEPEGIKYTKKARPFKST